MKNLFLLATIGAIFTACGESQKEDTWEAPQLKILRLDNSGKASTLENTDVIFPTDRVYFEDPQAHSIESNVRCSTQNKSIEEKKTFQNNFVIVRDTLPVKATLFDDSIICQIKITLKNQKGSSKLYQLLDKKVDLSKISPEIKIPDRVYYSEFSKVFINGTKPYDVLNLVCENLHASFQVIENSSPTLENLAYRDEVPHKDIDIRQYSPYQTCRVTHNQDSKLLISNKFEIRFEKLSPSYKAQIRSDNRHGGRLIVYELNLSNPHNVPITVAFNRNIKVIPFRIRTQFSNREFDGVARYHNSQEEIAFAMNGNSKLVERGHITIVHILPGEEFLLTGYRDVGSCDDRRCVYSEADRSHLPIFDLKYNYRSLEEIAQAKELKLLDQTSVN